MHAFEDGRRTARYLLSVHTPLELVEVLYGIVGLPLETPPTKRPTDEYELGALSALIE